MRILSLRSALLASTAFVVFGSGSALAQAGGSCVTVDGAQVCEGDQPDVNAYGFGLDSFTNTGSLNSTFLYLYRSYTPFTFLNTETGLIISHDYPVPAVFIGGSNLSEGFDVESLVNRGVIGSSVGAAIVTEDTVSIGGFENSGIIAAVGEGHTPDGCFFSADYAVEIEGRVTGDFVNTGLIGATDTAVHVAEIGGDFINENLITVLGGEEYGNYAVNLGLLEGDFYNGLDAEISGFADGVRVTEIGGDFINEGYISGEVEAIHIGFIDGNFINHGTIEATGDYGENALSIGVLGGNFVNGETGEILGENYGLLISTVDGEIVVNAGLISSRYTAVEVYHAQSDFQFSNTGDILSSQGSGVFFGGGYGEGTEGQGTGALGYGDFDGLITFNNEGNIIAAYDGVFAYADIASFTNSGLIDGGYAGVSLFGESESFFNSGDIIGGVVGVGIGFLAGDFVNTGLIEAVRGYVSDRQSGLPGESIPGPIFALGVSGGYINGDFVNTGTIRAATSGVTIYSLAGHFINQGLIESTVSGSGPMDNQAGESSAYYTDYAVDIYSLGGGVETPRNAGGGSDIGLEDLSFINDTSAQIIGAGGGVRIANLMGPGFFNDGLISSTYDAVTVGRAFTDYIFSNSGNIVSTEGTGVSLGLRGSAPMQEPLDARAAAPGGDHSYGPTIDFYNSGSILAGLVGVEIGNDVNGFRNEGLISGGAFGVHLSSIVEEFVNEGLIFATGIDGPPEPPQRPLDGLQAQSGPSFFPFYSGDAVWLEYVTGGFSNGRDGVIEGSLRGVNISFVANMFVNQGVIRGAYQGLQIYSLAGNFINDGLIEQTELTDAPDAAAVALIYFQGDDGFYNTANGEIRSQAEGVHIYQSLNGDFLNDGLISSVGDAVVIELVNGTRAFENNGDILSTEGVGVDLFHVMGGYGNEPAAEGEVIDLTFRNTGAISSTVLGVRIEGLVSLFENSGDITGGKVAVDLYGDVGALINAGSITGNQTGIRFNDNIQILINTGSITGLTGGDSGTGAGVRVYGDGGVYLVNNASGVISGFTGVALGDGDDFVVNTGILTGTGGVAASLGGGDDTFFSSGFGTISGAIDGGADFDTFVASGTQTLDMALDNFEAMLLVFGRTTFGRNQSADYMLASGSALDLGEFTFTGDFLSATRLYADGGSVDGNVVNFGSILALDLTITGDLYNAGVINPGGTGAIGTLTVLGDFYALNLGDPVDVPGGDAASDARAQAAASVAPSSSTLVFNFSGLNHDRIIVTGAATLGGDLLVTGDLGEVIKARQDITLVSAASINGGFNLINLGGVLFAPQVGVVGANVLLSFAQNNFVASLAPQTRNQSQAALGLEDRWDLGASAADDIILALNNGAAPAPILEAFAPETSAALTRQSARIGTQLAQTVANCAIGPNAAACGQRQSDGNLMIWTNVSASGARIKGDGNAASVDEAFSQVSSGAEIAFANGFAGGIFLASGTGDVDIAQGQRGHGEVDSVAGGLYGRFNAGGFTLAGLAGYADTDMEARRQTPFGTSIGQTGGSVSFARLDARLTLISGVSQAGFAMSGTYAYAEMGNFAQRGAGGFDLDIVGDSFRVEDWELRGFFGHQFEPSQSGYLWSFGGTAGLVHANGEDMASVAASFPGATAAYETLGPRTDDTGGVASGYIDLASPLAGVTAQIGVEGRWMAGEDSSRVYGRFAWTF